ncbi:MAG: hypothetical protein ACRD1C_04080 [Terriglobales bacterium]
MTGRFQRAVWLAALAATPLWAQTVPVQRVGAYAPASGVIHPAWVNPEVTGTHRLGPGQGLGLTPPAPRPVFHRRAPAGQRARRLPTEATAPPPPPPLPPAFPDLAAAGREAEQTRMGTRPAARLVASFDGLGNGFTGLNPPPALPARFRHPFGALDLSLAAGPTQIVEIINSQLAVFNKHGKLLYGSVPTNTVFAGSGGRCASTNSGDAVVRYDQLAQRWLIVMPIFSRPSGQPAGAFGMCYAVSTTTDALGTYHRYEFRRSYFPDYPRPAVWPDGYYVPTSSGDGVIQKMDCVADRARMLRGEDATEQCVLIDGVSFLNNADLDGTRLPPAGAPNIVMAAGGTQLKEDYSSDVIYWFKFHVDWKNAKLTKITSGAPIKVAPYHFLCNGQLSHCVAQPGSQVYLDSQGDKLMQRLVYRRWGSHQSLVAVHSVDTAAHSGGVRWYEFRLDRRGDPELYQQGTYAPDAHDRWMASAAMDKFGDIGIGYSYGGDGAFPGQRFAARRAGDPRGQLTLAEATLAQGGAAQARSNRWEDYTTTAIDPSDDCTFWYVGDYLKAGAPASTTHIGAFRLPGCR